MINTKKKNKKINNILLNSLFKSKNFYGESTDKTNKTTLPFIYGIRHNNFIINLKHTSFFIKRSFKLMQKAIQKNKKILIIGNSDDIKYLTNSNFTKKNSNIIYFNEEWINGLITNNQINSFFNKKKIDLVFIIKSSTNEKYLSTELSSLQIPIISFVNTDKDLRKINYPILTNLKNIKSIYILMYLIRKII